MKGNKSFLKIILISYSILEFKLFPGGHIANGSVIVVKDHFVYMLHGNNKVQKKFVYYYNIQ